MNMLVKCKVCANGNATVALTVNGWSIYQCDECLSRFVHPQPKENEIADYCATCYKDNPVLNGMIANNNYGYVTFKSQALIIEHLSKVKKVKILDYGCGGGHFLSHTPRDWQKYGIEISKDARDVATTKGISVYESLDEASFADKYFDIITMFATIEHLPEPEDVICRLGSLLRIGGLFVIMTGDVTSVKARRDGRNWQMYTPPGHLFFFSAASIDSMMSKLGFKKVKALYTNGGMASTPLGALTLIVRGILFICEQIPILNNQPFFDHYYGYYLKEDDA